MESITMETMVFGYCDSGFFSNCNIILTHIINYFNQNKKLPNKIITYKMFNIYKTHPEQDIYNLIFKNNDNHLSYDKEIKFNEEGFENQFSDYKLLNLSDIQPIFKNYFMPNQIILSNVELLLNKYNINFNEDICGVFFRGNDKIKETQKPPYNEFIEKAKQLKESNPNIKFIIQTDELEFLNSFLIQFSDTIFFEEIPAISNTSNTNISRILKNDAKIRHVIDFVSIIYIFSKFKYLITTSGNCEIFITFYRNNTDNLFQYLKKNKYIHGGLNKDYNEVDNVWY